MQSIRRRELKAGVMFCQQAKLRGVVTEIRK